tara:strand:+ start:2491 stop:3498 length:1008 start_codon:yes stop_codon:yes gene_type:complete
MLRRRDLGLSLAGGSLALLATQAVAGPHGVMRDFALTSRYVPGQVDVSVYTPPQYATAKGLLPLVVLLHGGNGSSRDLSLYTAAIEHEMISGRLMPMVIAMPSARRSLYMDFKDGSQRWEQFILDDLIPNLRRKLNIADKAEGTCLAGISMGGLGALRIAFKHPHLFKAVAALEPAIEPALSWTDVGPSVLFWRPESVLYPMFGNPIDLRFWQENNPATIAKSSPGKLLGLSIYFEVGDQDMLHLYDGAEFLHRILYDARIAHEFRLVHGAEHVGPSLLPRMIDALGFLQRQLQPPAWINDDVRAAQQAMDAQKRAIGLSPETPDLTRMKSAKPQ